MLQVASRPQSRRRPPSRLGALTLALVLPLLFGTTQAQRDRLPPPAADCEDAITGLWLAHVYYEHVHQWYRFRLEISEQSGVLSGTIHSEYWDGDAKDEQPPACGAPHHRRAVFEPATGSFDGNFVVFQGTSWTVDTSQSCPEVEPDYLVDHFSGALDAEHQEFMSVLNADTPEWTDVPTVFRRVACTPPKTPEPVVAPPPYTPPTSRFGCNW